MSDNDSERTEEGGTEPFTERVDYRRVASVVFTVLVVLAVLPFVVYAFPGLVGAEHSYVVLSGSMEPTMSPGDVVVVEDIDPEKIEERDVISYKASGAERPTTHRVIEVTQENGQPAFRTEGDANEDPDSGVVRASEVEGRVPTIAGHPFVIPYVGHVIMFASTQFGFSLLFVTPLVLFVGSEIYELVMSSRSSGDLEMAGDTSEDEGSTADEESEESNEEEDDEEPAVTMSRAELSFGLAVLGAFFAYSLWVAYATVTVWAMTISGATGAAFLMLSGLYLFGGTDSDVDTVDEDSTGGSDDGGTIDEEFDSSETGALTKVPDLEDLFADWSTGDDEANATAGDPEELLAADDPFDDWDLPDAWDEEDTNTPDEIVFGDDGREGVGDD
jgi:signal peptidase